jgi:Flp pilus assembly protein TadD
LHGAGGSPSDDAQVLVKQGQKLNNEGKQDEALVVYKQALEKSPNSYEAHLESGVALDPEGRLRGRARAP